MVKKGLHLDKHNIPPMQFRDFSCLRGHRSSGRKVVEIEICLGINNILAYIYFTSCWQCGNNSSILVTIRFCSSSGGMGITVSLTLSEFKLFTTAPDTLPQN